MPNKLCHMSCGPPAKENGCYNINVLRVLEHSLAGGPFYFLTSHSAALIFKYEQVLLLQPTVTSYVYLLYGRLETAALFSCSDPICFDINYFSHNTPSILCYDQGCLITFLWRTNNGAARFISFHLNTLSDP